MRKRQASALKKISLLAIFILTLPVVFSHFTNDAGGRFQTYSYISGNLSGPVKIELTTIERPMGRYVSDFDMVHEKIMHIFIVGQDLSLSTFSHIHPQDFPEGLSRKMEGILSVNYTFLANGKYALISDFTVEGESSLNMIPIYINDKFKTTQLKNPELDFSSRIQSGRYSVSLETPSQVYSGREFDFSYFIEKDGHEVNNLQLYLGSEIHVLAVKDDFTMADHYHAFVPGHYIHIGVMPQHYSGPRVPVRMNFTEPGFYALFAQFKENDSIVTSKHLVKVAPSQEYRGEIVFTYAAVLITMVFMFLILFFLIEKKY